MNGNGNIGSNNGNGNTGNMNGKGNTGNGNGNKNEENNNGNTGSTGINNTFPQNVEVVTAFPTSYWEVGTWCYKNPGICGK